MTVVLLRHGRSTSNTAHTLAGRSPGVELDDHGHDQARAVVDRLVGVPVEEIVRSPLLRCAQTVDPLARARGLDPVVEERLLEVDYGDWTGRELKALLEEPLWKVVQQHASAAVFPGGEGLAQVQARAVAAVREHDARLTETHGRDVVWVACTHGDVIKSILADALGSHLDGFQRIVAEPASISVVRYTETRPFVLRVNDTGGDLSGIASVTRPRQESRAQDDTRERDLTGSVPGGEV
ncbi:MSMEG_4193 family putative phosphomutase [Rhodococcus triatomae]|uniref:Probable phosphomutase, MSMEG_4193 family n=1 Tax=Rhodococcus triatomae TaxID=300028 RepID=A0A1G8P976_9NOCA|nr:histidine phosphatase family protein [Rhodococcus triatomae]QNG18732.1 MSMEG_4193 family putative phosphomutase [Rhodococcus triatomae]QNG25358.1 MSMEG_4193 family putative phosphomutase [Rhodococcus triatomae]SDI88320.1 probable phosphomutase, MSMEG_4193 family [Rhodococcus triatomae]